MRMMMLVDIILSSLPPLPLGNTLDEVLLVHWSWLIETGVTGLSCRALSITAM
jgi:hypothetical protein